MYGTDDQEIEFREPEITWERKCRCGRTVYHYRGEGDVSCECGTWFNAFGQELVSDWMDNPSWKYDDVDDCEGYEIQHSSW